jgi:hypothetical protein
VDDPCGVASRVSFGPGKDAGARHRIARVTEGLLAASLVLVAAGPENGPADSYDSGGYSAPWSAGDMGTVRLACMVLQEAETIVAVM